MRSKWVKKSRDWKDDAIILLEIDNTYMTYYYVI